MSRHEAWRRELTAASARPAQSLQAKAAQHVVEPSDLGVFLVKSGSSGAVYTVRPVVEGALSSAVCSCEWGRRGRGDCSHVVAVRNFAARFVEAR